MSHTIQAQPHKTDIGAIVQFTPETPDSIVARFGREATFVVADACGEKFLLLQTFSGAQVILFASEFELVSGNA